MNQQKIAIMVDSGTDVPPRFRDKYEMYWLPLLINYTDRQCRDGIDIQPQEMYDLLPVEIPKTSLPEGGMVEELFDRIRADGFEKVLVVTISSGLSGTYNMVRLIAEDYKGLDIFVLDTKNISIGSGMLAIRAAQMVYDEGVSWEDLKVLMPREVPHSKVFFCLDTLKYLQKGGRIGLVTAMLGASLSLKPIISCNENGIYYTAGKAIGRARSIQKVIDLAHEFAKGSAACDLAVMNGCAPEEGHHARNVVEGTIVNGTVTVTGQIGAALGVHTGPGLIGVGVLQR
ncbi:MAG: DegV family protein [Clostridia bacterium]|nr:DegV family protein [Clostridia bacterium]